MNGLAGTRSLVRLILRRDRLILPIWIFFLVLLPVATASAFAELYPDAAERAVLTSTVGSNPALSGLLGQVFDSSIGGLTAWRVSFVFIGVALMSLLTVVRHTRAEEEAGRRELLGSTVVGRHAPLAAALSVMSATNLIIGALIIAGFTALDLPDDGSVAFGLSVAAAGLMFGAIAAVSAQLVETAGAAKGIAGLVLGASFLARFVGDVDREGNLSWLVWGSPLGWMQQVRSFADERWWVFGMAAALVVVMSAAAYTLSSRRDMGAGMFPQRLGPAEASPLLRSPFALAWRLQWRSLVAWTSGFAVVGLIIGGIADSATAIVNQTPQLQAIFERLGGASAFADLYFFAIMNAAVLIASVYSVGAVLRLRSEELNLRAEPLLATSIHRLRWAGSHLVFGIVGPAIVLTAFGITAGLSFGALTEDIQEQVPRVIVATLSFLPAVWILTGLAIALFGLLPRLTAWVWGALVAFFVLGQLGEILQLPQWALDLSPFTHVPNVLMEESAMPLVWLCGIAIALVTLGLAAFRRRDIG